jgi:hypothetical protein
LLLLLLILLLLRRRLLLPPLISLMCCFSVVVVVALLGAAAAAAAALLLRCPCHYSRFKILGCHHQSVANIDAYWICPEEGGTAFPSDNVCVCDNADIRTCGFHVGNVMESGVYVVKGYGGTAFSAYLDYDTEMGKVRVLCLECARHTLPS